MPLEFDTSNAFQLANSGINQNIAWAERICAEEQRRIELANQPEVNRLRARFTILVREQSDRHAIQRATPACNMSRPSLPVFSAATVLLFAIAGLALAHLALQPYGFGWQIWPCSIALALLCAFATAELLNRFDYNVVVRSMVAALFLGSIGTVAVLAIVRGDVFALALKGLLATSDGGQATTEASAISFYADTAPKIRLFLVLLAVSLELASGVALHKVQLALTARRISPDENSRRLEGIEREIGLIIEQLTFLHNQPEAYGREFMRNVYVGLLDGASRHARRPRSVGCSARAFRDFGFRSSLDGAAALCHPRHRPLGVVEDDELRRQRRIRQKHRCRRGAHNPSAARRALQGVWHNRRELFTPVRASLRGDPRRSRPPSGSAPKCGG